MPTFAKRKQYNCRNKWSRQQMSSSFYLLVCRLQNNRWLLLIFRAISKVATQKKLDQLRQTKFVILFCTVYMYMHLHMHALASFPGFPAFSAATRKKAAEAWGRGYTLQWHADTLMDMQEVEWEWKLKNGMGMETCEGTGMEPCMDGVNTRCYLRPPSPHQRWTPGRSRWR